MKNKNILILGGDKRSSYLRTFFAEKGFISVYINVKIQKEDLLKNISDADIIILPLPFTKDGDYVFSESVDFKLRLDTFIDTLKDNQIVAAGKTDALFRQKLKEKGIKFFDYYEDCKLTKTNSYLTSLGALKLLFENNKKILRNKKVLVTGYGNISEILCKMLNNLEMNVYVAARKQQQRNGALNCGYNSFDISDIPKYANDFDYIFNTVPSRIFTECDIENMKDSCLFTELASAPFGADKIYFDKYYKKYIYAPSLPGRFYPEEAARAVYDSIYEFIFKR